jgi:predicted nucleic acid-binding Zn ribbon protein
MTACLHCNKEFVKAANVQKYCSADCRNEATSTRGPQREVCCKGCSVKFLTTNLNKEFCTNECRWTYCNNQRETSKTQFRDCVVCGKAFQPMQKTGPGRKWCSETCKHIMNGNPERLKKVALSNAVEIEQARDYRRKFALKRNFGLTLEQYEGMYLAQDGKCAICNQPETANNNYDKVTRRLAVDHCHKTGKIRQLLCTLCNQGLGSFKDDPVLIQAAIEYLKSHSETE